MTDIPLPQSPSDSRAVMRSIDENGNVAFSQVGFQELDFGAVFGGKTTSTSQNSIGYGLQVFTLDIDDGKIIRGCKVEITSLDDPDCWEIGIVASKDLTVSPGAITVFIKKISPLKNTSSNWEIQIVDDAAANVAMLGYSTTSLQFGSGHDIFVGATVSVTTDANKLFQPGSHVVLESLADGTQYFRIIAQAYNASTGALSGFVTDVGPSATGTLAAWSLFAQDGPAVNSQFIATSLSSVTGLVTPQTIIIQAGKDPFFVANALITVVSASNQAKLVTAAISSYNNSTGSLVFNPFSNSIGVTPITDAIVTVVLSPGYTGSGSYPVPVVWTQALELLDPAPGGNGLILQSRGTPVNQPLNLTNDSGGAAHLSINTTSTVVLNGTPPAITGSPASGNLAKFSAATSITNGDLTGDVTTSGALATTIKSNVALAGSPTTTTQSANDNSTKIATTQYADRAAPRAIFSATVTPTPLGINASAVNATTDVATFTAHGCTAGECAILTGTVPAGLTTARSYYLGVVDANNVTFHLTQMNAVAGTSKVDITGTTTGWSFRRLALTNLVNKGTIGLAAAGGIGFGANLALPMVPEFNLAAVPLDAPVVSVTISGLVGNSPATAQKLWIYSIPTLANSNQTFNYPSGSLLVSDGNFPTSPGGQGTTAFTVSGIVF